MSFFLYSKWGDSLTLGRLLEDHGADVALYVDDEIGEHVGEGLIERTDNPNPSEGDVVVFDDTGLGDVGTNLRERGFAVIGANPYDRALGKRRADGMAIMKENHIGTPEDHEFPTIQAAIKWLEKQDGDWFVKVDGDLGDSSTTNGDTAHIVRYLDWLALNPGKVKGVELQKKAIGEEISVEGWFDGQRFVFPFNATIEEKKFMAGDVGPRTGCESCVVFAYDGPLVEELLKMEDTLREEGYIGSLDLNMIVTEKGPLGLEWTARLGFDASNGLFHLMGPTLPEQLEAFAYGALPAWEISPELALTLRFSIPPYPNDNKREAGKLYGFPLDKKVLDLDYTDVALGSDGPICAGRDGLLGVATVLGTDIDSLRKEALQRVSSMKISMLQYRIDPTHRFEDTMEGLEKKGLL